MIDKRDIKHPEAGFATRSIEVLTARLDRENLRPADAVGNVTTGVLVSMLERALPFHMLMVSIRIGQPMERTANDRLRLVHAR